MHLTKQNNSLTEVTKTVMLCFRNCPRMDKISVVYVCQQFM